MTTETMTTITIAARFCGPPGSGNGGYTAGRLAAFIDGPAEVTLRRPSPLDRALAVVRLADGSVELRDGDTLIAAARSASPVAIAKAIAPPSLADARAAAARTFDASLHAIPGCFVCGPGRTAGDGLRIHVGPVDAADTDWTGVLAAPWIPDAGLAGADGRVRPEFLWAALDCPTAYASATAAGMPPILLGRQTVAIEALPPAGDTLVVAAKRRSCDGRKHYSDAALFTADGRRLAVGNSVWIEVAPEVLHGAA
ncbi:MAG: hypothetical protein U5K76_03880 [Woeseiaceae bacterium]|nr:hypothetical protein [Woeseiaceae bacterium]